jgi:hypothetical protein
MIHLIARTVSTAVVLMLAASACTDHCMDYDCPAAPTPLTIRVMDTVSTLVETDTTPVVKVVSDTIIDATVLLARAVPVTDSTSESIVFDTLRLVGNAFVEENAEVLEGEPFEMWAVRTTLDTLGQPVTRYSDTLRGLQVSRPQACCNYPVVANLPDFLKLKQAPPAI